MRLVDANASGRSDDIAAQDAATAVGSVTLNVCVFTARPYAEIIAGAPLAILVSVGAFGEACRLKRGGTSLVQRCREPSGRRPERLLAGRGRGARKRHYPSLGEDSGGNACLSPEGARTMNRAGRRRGWSVVAGPKASTLVWRKHTARALSRRRLPLEHHSVHLHYCTTSPSLELQQPKQNPAFPRGR